MLIKFAETPEEKLAAYRLRFDCLTVELGDTRWADLEKRTYIDDLDLNERSKIAICRNGQETVGTMSLYYRSEGEFLGESFYDWEKLSECLGDTAENVKRNSALVARAATDARFRRQKVFARLLSFCENEARKSNSCYMITSIEDGNTISTKSFLLHNYNDIKELRQYKQFRGFVFYKTL